MGDPMYDRLLDRKNVEADAELLLVGDLVELIFEETAVVEDALNHEPVQQHKRLLGKEAFVFSFLVICKLQLRHIVHKEVPVHSPFDEVFVICG